MAHFRLTDGDGNVLLDGPLPGPGGEVRFGVGSAAGPRSGTWRVWANKGASDVYVASRPLAGVEKISLHESGDWRLQYVRRDIAKQWAPGQGRVIDRWPRPPETIPGWTRSLIIWVPESDVTLVPQGHEERKLITWVPKPQPGEIVAFHVVIARPDTGFVNLQEQLPLDAFSLANGEICLLLVSVESVARHQGWLDKTRSQVMASVNRLDLDGMAAPRAAVFAVDDEGLRAMWDLAIPVVGPLSSARSA